MYRRRETPIAALRSLNPDALIPSPGAQSGHPPPLDATRAETTPFGFPSIYHGTDSDQAVFFVSAFESCPDR